MLTFDHSGAPQELMKRLQAAFGVTTFIEAGTYHGDTARWASHVFPHVVTIEKSEELFEQTKNRSDAGSVRYLLGDTRQHLPSLLAAQSSAAIFWLDAHWSGGQTAGYGDECPLMMEIELIAASGVSHFVFVDDARFFLSPPPSPHAAEQWPTISEVLVKLSALPGEPYIIILQDVIIAVPAVARTLVAHYCRDLYEGGHGFARIPRASLRTRLIRRLKTLLAAPASSFQRGK